MPAPSTLISANANDRGAGRPTSSAVRERAGALHLHPTARRRGNPQVTGPFAAAPVLPGGAAKSVAR